MLLKRPFAFASLHLMTSRSTELSWKQKLQMSHQSDCANAWAWKGLRRFSDLDINK